MRPAFLTVLIAIIVTVIGEAAEPTPDEIEFFEHRIRPILVEHCYECHNTAETSESDLSLDHRDALLRGGQSGPVISDTRGESLLLKVIRHEIEGLEMPEGGARLSDDVVEDFEKWVSMGAPDPRDEPPSVETLAESTSWEAVREKRKRWWSFQPIVRPEVPVPSAEGESDTAIDQFIQTKLRAGGLSPVGLADRIVLARRLSFALIGLPPDPKEVEVFVRDRSERAYQAYVDRLLDSPRFGERWARHWMDWVRYAESHGSEGDPRIVGAHHYRDHLIRTLNANVPYDQMVREHIAGDLLGSPRVNHLLGINESQVATAHWRMVFHGFTPTDAMEEKVRFTDDAINVFSKAFLGLTVSCARCHNHKFDAISQADYYALFGIIGSTRPGRAPIDAPGRLVLHREELQKQKTEIKKAIANQWIDSFQLHADGDDEAGPLSSFVQKLTDADDFQSALAKQIARLNRDEQWMGHGVDRDAVHRWHVSDTDYPADWYRYGTGTSGVVSSAGAFAIHPSGDRIVRGVYPAGVYSHLISDKHNAVIASQPRELDEEYELWLCITGGGSAIARYVVQDYPRKGTVYPVTELKETGWRWQKYDLAYWKGDPIHIELATANDSAVEVRHQDRSWFGIREAALLPKQSRPLPRVEAEWMDLILDRARSASPDSQEDFASMMRSLVDEAITAWRENTISDPQALLLDRCLAEGFLPNTMDTLSGASSLVSRYRQLEKEIPIPRRAPALAEWRGSDQPLLQRGDHHRPGEVIPRRFLEAIDPTPYMSDLSGRRKLAEDVLRPDNPLTARVIVNRIWHHLFGRGIVATNDNFGRLGETPTHPELLDYLADEFRTTDAWSIKTMIRRVVCSETWRQSSTPSKRAQRIDPDNRLYSFYPIRRLEAESIRDAMLAVSGQLDTTMFGEPADGGSDRRSVYVKVIRNALDPFLTTFDAPVPFATKGRRDVTNVPAQALMMMNDPQVIRLANRFADRATANSSLDGDDARIDWMWRQALGREPTVDERNAAANFLADSAQRYQRFHEDFRQGSKDSDQMSAAKKQRNQPWVDLALSIFNMKEFIYVR